MEGLVWSMEGLEWSMEGLERSMEGLERSMEGLERSMEGLKRSMEGLEWSMPGDGGFRDFTSRVARGPDGAWEREMESREGTIGAGRCAPGGMRMFLQSLLGNQIARNGSRGLRKQNRR